MAEPKQSFPMLPVAHWWALRKKFKQSIPGVVTDNYLATVLSMGVNSARANVLPFLKVLGIIDQDGKTQERAKLWRDDVHYPDVCKQILRDVYPEELLQAAADPNDRGTAERWFGNHTGTGEAASRRMAALYMVLLDGDPAKQPEQEKKTPTKSAERPKTVRASTTPAAPKESEKQPRSDDKREKQQYTASPDININLQIHISSDASPDQIEQIFAAMAKHIYQRS